MKTLTKKLIHKYFKNNSENGFMYFRKISKGKIIVNTIIGINYIWNVKQC